MTKVDQQSPAIVARDVNVVYRNGHQALWDVNFTIPRGTVTALVGVNGAGKSTLFKAIMGFVGTSSGSIRIFDQDVRSALKANLVAYVPQSEDVDWAFPVLVEDVVMMGRYGHMGFLRRPKRAGRDIQPPAIQPHHRVFEPVALGPDQIVRGDFAIVKLHLPGGLGFPAHLVL